MLPLPVGSDGRAKAEDLRRQADLYCGIVHACLRNLGCTAVQTGGFTDKYSWIGRHSRAAWEAALPFHGGYNPKLAYGGLGSMSLSPRRPEPIDGLAGSRLSSLLCIYNAQ